MFFLHVRTAACRLVLALLSVSLAGRLTAAQIGPTLHFDYGQSQSQTNPLSHFMYFVPLVSPEQVCLFTNRGNTQGARVSSFHCRTNGVAFHAVCEFNFVGEGVQRNLFDHAIILQRRAKELQSGKTLAHQLAAISVQGGGLGSLEIDGTLTNGQPVVGEMRLRFNSHGHPSPVTVNLQDIALRHGIVCFDNEIVARVNTLTFRQKVGPPKMEVALASVKRANAGNGKWQNLVGDLKGAAANLLLPPLNITTNGQETMMDFSLALALQLPGFTFPLAERLTVAGEIIP
jgi:hypothetical protein